MINGVLAERHPATVRAIREEGHELVAHCYGMDMLPVYLEEAQQLEAIRCDTALIEHAAGARPTGWISPRATGSFATPRLLAGEGYLWHGDCNDDDLPAILEFDGSAGGAAARIVAIPLTMEINDLPHAIRYGNAPGAFVQNFKDILEGMRKADDAAVMLDVTAHTHVYGRPAGAWAYDAVMGLARAAPDVWIGTREEIARHALALGRDVIA